MQNKYYLYADDDLDDIALLNEAVQASEDNKSLVAVGNGYELLAYLQAVKKGDPYPALIILDINMPRLNGTETLELLKTDDLFRLIPVVMLTTTINKEDDLVCNRLGVDIITKPTKYTHWNLITKKLSTYCDAA